MGLLRWSIQPGPLPRPVPGHMKAVEPIPAAQRHGPIRWRLLCAHQPHHWWPVGRYGQLCLRCSLYLRDRDTPDHGQG